MILSLQSNRTATSAIAGALTLLMGLPAFAQPQPTSAKPAAGKPASGKKGEVQAIKRAKAEEPKAKESKADDPKKKLMAGPEQRRTRERSSAEDIDDELAILRELLDIERGSETEADTLLEISYVLWDRAEAYETEAYDEAIERCINTSEDPLEKKDCETRQRNLLEQGRAAKLDVINHLKRIERLFPRFVKLDEVLYSLGFHLNELERPGEAVDAFMRLVRKRPNSNFLPDAYLGIGNYYFSKNQGGEALKYYHKVAEFPDSPIYGWGLYYVAWVHYNTQQWDQAVKGFIRVLDYSKNEARGRVTFVEDASKYLVRSWAETGNPKQALAFFKKVAPGTEILLLDNLALHYAEVSAYDKSNIVLDDLIEYAKDDAQMVRYVTLRLENSYKLHDLEETVKSALMLGNALKQGGKLSEKRRSDLELLLAEVASTYHSEYERTLHPPTLDAAEKIYRVYGEHFVQGSHAYDMLHNHALALYQQERWADSAAMYERVIELQPTGKYAEPSAHRALIAYLRLQSLNAETGEKAMDTADLRPIALTEDEERVARACERYIDIALKNNSKEDVPEALFVAGRLWYQKNHFEKAAALLGKFIDRFPEYVTKEGQPLAYDAARLLVSALFLGQDGKGLRLWVDKLIVDTRFNQGKLGETLTEFKSNEEYNKCLELKDTPIKAAQCLVTYATNFKDNKQAPRALSGAIRFYRQAKKREDIVATCQLLQKTFPEDQRAPEALMEIGYIYQESGDYDQAATAFEAFVKAYPTHEKAPRALAMATRFRELLGAYEKVEEDGELFLTHFSKDARAAEVAYNVSVQYVKKGDWKAVLRASDKFLKRSDKIPTELRLAALINVGTAQYKLAQGDRGKKLFDEVVKTAKELADGGKMAELPQIGRDAIAQALFMTGEVEFDKVKAMKNSAKDLAAAAKLAADKVGKAKGADAWYAQAEEAKNPKWVAAAASRRGRIYQEIGASIKALPAPPAFAKSEELKNEWASQLADKAKPHEDTAVERYRAALQKAAEIFAFDSYWAEARDNLKILDPKFAESVDIKEFMVELSPFRWAESAKPDAAVRDLRLKLFELSTGEVSEEVVQAASETEKVNPALAQAYGRLAQAHHALGQHRECIVAISYGMRAAPELKKSAVLWNLLGLSYQSLGSLRESLLAFEEAAKADPKATEPLLNAASITVRHLDFKKTVELLDEVLKREPGNYWAAVTRPVAVRRASDDPAQAKEALAALDELVKKDSKPEAHYNRCVIAQAVLTGSKPEVAQALAACEDAVKAVGGHKLSKELVKRRDGLKQALEFMP